MNQINMKSAISIFLILVSLGIVGVRISKSVAFEQQVTGYLKRAADANTIELADEELTRAIDFLEKNKITSGYTSILYQTPDEDVDFWYRNLKASQNELRNLVSDSALEKTNVLMKLRETLMDVGEKTEVTVPDGIDVYPDNKLWAILMTLAFCCGIGGLIILTVEADRKSKKKAADAGKRKLSSN